MKRVGLFLFLILLVPAVASAQILDIEKVDKGSVVISGTDNPANFEFTITNNGPTDSFEIYTLLGITMTPRGTFKLETGIPTKIQVQAYPSKGITSKFHGFYIFDYEIRSPLNGITKDRLTINILDIDDVVQVSVNSVKPSDDFAKVTVRNTKNTQINNIHAVVNSKFFDMDETLSLSQYEEKNFTVPLKKENIQRILAGQYDIPVDLEADNARSSSSTGLNYLEQSGVAVTTTTSGVIISKKIIDKKNEGNIVAETQIESKKNILTRLFTVSSPSPDSVQKEGLFVNYIWQKSLNPGETLHVEVTTNYTVPFLLVIAAIIIIAGVKLYAWTPVKVTKRATLVKTKGGETAFRIRLIVHAHSHVDSVQLIDRIPAMMKMYDKSGTKPDKIDESTRRISWNIPRLNSGEERVYTYIVYSSLKTVGRLELGPATVIFEKNGKTHENLSNSTFVASESASY